MYVDHSDPIHDSYCRCRACKPPLPSQSGDRAWLGLILIFSSSIIVMGIVTTILR